jgi:hypothetical protein
MNNNGQALDFIERPLKKMIMGISGQVANKVEDFFSPVFLPGEAFHRQVYEQVKGLPRKPYLSQVAALAALVKGFRTKRALGLVGEMGSGKTSISILTGHLLGKRKRHPIRTLVICPPTLVSTWVEEVPAVLGDKAVAVDANGPDCLRRLIALRNAPMIPEKDEYWIIGLNRVKTNAPWESKVTEHPRLGHICPDCFKALSALENDVGPGKLTCNRYRCPHCGAPMWGYKFDERRVYAPVNYITDKLKRHFSLFVADEAHKFKAGDSIQGAVLGQLAEALPKTLILTGTLSGGKSSDVFYLLQRAYALNYGREERMRKLPEFKGLKAFVEKYGTLEKVYRKGVEDRLTGRASKEGCSIREKAGVSPKLLVDFFVENSIFLRISDISDALPGYTEILEFTDLPDDLLDEYRSFSSAVRNAAMTALHDKDKTVLGQMVSTLLAWPDLPERPVQIRNVKGDIVAEAPAMYVGQNTPKDERLIEVVSEANAQGRNCLIFAEYTGFGALEYLEKRLTGAGLRVLLMKPSVPTHKRLDWIREKMSSRKYDNLLCHPKLVETGLNLREFPEILFWQTGYSTFVLRQASRRSWRPGQTKDVEVRFFINRGTFQENAMSLIAEKLESALLLEGELSDQGLVSLSGKSGIGDLARQLVGAAGSGQNLEKVFASYRALESQALASASTLNIAFDAAGNLGLEDGGIAVSPEVLDEVEDKNAVVTMTPDVAAAPARHKASVVDLRARMRTMKLLGELFPVGDALSGRVRKKEFIVRNGDLLFGNELFDREGNFALDGDMGTALDFVLVKRPGLLGASWMVYGAA